MMTYSETPAGFTARVRMSSGELAGEGYGPTAETAAFFAVKDAMKSTNERYATAGRGHRVFLTPANQAQLESYQYNGMEAPGSCK